MPENDFQNSKIILGNGNARTTPKRVCARNELEDPMVALIVHGHLIVPIDGIRGSVAGNLKSFEKGVQLQDHGASTSSRFPSTETAS